MITTTHRRLAGFAVGSLAVVACGVVFHWRSVIQTDKAPEQSLSPWTELTINGVQGRLYRLDFGVAQPRTQMELKQEVVNDTNTRWTVKQVVDDCGCTIAEFSPRTVQPGQTGTLRVHFKCPGGQGNVQRRILLRFQENAAPVILVQLSGNLRDWAQAVPETLAFPQVFPGRSCESPCAIAIFGSQSIATDHVETSHPWVSVRFGARESDSIRDDEERGAEQTMCATCAPPKGTAPGSYRGRMRLVSADGQEDLEIPYSIKVRAPVDVVPEHLFLGFVPMGSTIHERVKLTLRDRLVKPLSDIVVTHSMGHELTVLPEHSSDATLLLHAVFSPSGGEGIRLGNILVALQDGEEIATIDVQAKVVSKRE